MPWVVLFVSGSATAQLNRGAYTFLDVPSNARQAALGGINVSLADKDPSSFISNPALAGDTLSGFAAATYQFYIGDIGHANFAWLPRLGKMGTVAFGVQHFRYGSIAAYDPSGNELGDLNAEETALYISKQHQIQNFRFGLSLKMISSSLAGFRSEAIAFDLGGLFIHPEKDFTAGLVIRNAGFVLRDYSPGSSSVLPFDVQAGMTFRPEHMPVRFSVVVHRLARIGEVSASNDANGLDNVLRHFNFGAEILLHRNVNVLLGYNYGLHEELKLENAGGSAGLTYGFSAHIKTIDFVFSRSTYVAGSAAYTLSLAVDLRSILQ
jgi:hypothetical protein